MFCGACGTKNDDGRRFCKNCGADLMQFVVTGTPAQRPAPASQARPQQAASQRAQRPSSIPNPGPAVRPGSGSVPAQAPATHPAPHRGDVVIPRGATVPATAASPVPAGTAATPYGPTVGPAPVVARVPAGGLHAAAPASQQAPMPRSIGDPRQGTTVLDDLMSTPQDRGSASLPRTAADAPRSASAPKVTLVREHGSRYAITEFPASVGKGSAANVRIEGNSAISRVHAVISLNAGGFAIEDKGSTNGTYLNGDILAPGELVKLHAGDTLTLGDEDFKVEIR